jgi:hypothetical protein
MPDETPKGKTGNEQDASSKKDLPPKSVDDSKSDQVKGGFAKRLVDVDAKKVM